MGAKELPLPETPQDGRRRQRGPWGVIASPPYSIHFIQGVETSPMAIQLTSVLVHAPLAAFIVLFYGKCSEEKTLSETENSDLAGNDMLLLCAKESTIIAVVMHELVLSKEIYVECTKNHLEALNGYAQYQQHIFLMRLKSFYWSKNNHIVELF